MDDVGLLEEHRDVAVGVGGSVILERDRRVVEAQRPLAGKQIGRQSGCRKRLKIVAPVLHPLDRQEMLARVFMRQDGGAEFVQPFVAVGVVKVPVRVDQVRDRLWAKRRQRCGDLRARCRDAGIDQHLPVGAAQDRDIAAGSLEHGDVTTQSVDGN